MIYIIQETALPLLYAYEELAIKFKQKRKPRDEIVTGGEGILAKVQSKDYNNYSYTFALLSLNAAILEGTLRSILSEKVNLDIEEMARVGIRKGQTRRSSQEEVLCEFMLKLDTSGGWDSLKASYATYTGIKIGSKDFSDSTEAVDVLFTIRNTISHGTALIQPKHVLDELFAGEPLYKKQNKMQKVRTHLKDKFGHESIYDNLAEFKIPEYFMNHSVALLKSITKELESKGIIPERTKKLLKYLLGYSFGYRNLD